MNRRGLELLKQINEFPVELLTLLENELLPIQFKIFLKNYAVGQNWTNGETILVNEELMQMIWLTQIKMYEPDELSNLKYHACLDYIFDYTRLLEEIEKYRSKKENWNDLGFIQIGLMHWSDVLLLGVENSNRDEIWRYGTGMPELTCSKLSNNIFDFFSKLHESVDYENLADYGIKSEQIYRNLDEQFWRFKDKNER